MSDKIKGSLFGGAVGDALGYPVEFMSAESIFERYGEKGITKYERLGGSGEALISDDTQMTLFTANGILMWETEKCTNNGGGTPSDYVALTYQDWLATQAPGMEKTSPVSWLIDIPELHSLRAPGNTCLSALINASGDKKGEDYLKNPCNNSKGCGGIMRVAPLGLRYDAQEVSGGIEALDKEGAILAAITHGHSLGYMTAAVLVHIINRIVFPENPSLTLKEIVLEARDTVARIFEGDLHLEELVETMNRAILLAENDCDDLENIRRLGEGWVAEETLGISLYCSLRYEHDFTGGIIAAVNHSGDSDSTGAVTGNILGALVGYENIDEQWKNNLELADVILEVAEDLEQGCQVDVNGKCADEKWMQKYGYRKNV